MAAKDVSRIILHPEALTSLGRAISMAGHAKKIPNGAPVSTEASDDEQGNLAFSVIHDGTLLCTITLDSTCWAELPEQPVSTP
jgi:hypothetical protein